MTKSPEEIFLGKISGANKGSMIAGLFEVLATAPQSSELKWIVRRHQGQHGVEDLTQDETRLAESFLNLGLIEREQNFQDFDGITARRIFSHP